MLNDRIKLSRPVRKSLICAGIAVLTLVIIGAMAETRFAQIVHLKTLDLHFLLRGTRPVDKIVLIVIDQKSYDRIPDVQMFWHPYYAEVIRAAAQGGAKVLGLDIGFAVPVAKWEPDHDQLLAAAVAETAPVMPVVAGYVPSLLNRQTEWLVPVNMLASALGLSAYVNLTIDADDFVREQELLAAETAPGESNLRRSLALRVAEKFAGQDADYRDGRLTFGNSTVPVDDRKMRINYAGPPDTFPRISLIDFVSAARAGNWRQVRDWVDGSAVLVGVDSISDRHPTPFFTTFQGARWSSSGVEIHANTVRTLLTGEFLATAPRSIQIPVVLLTALVTATVLVFLPFHHASAYVLLTMLITGSAAQIAFSNGWTVATSAIQLSSLIPIPFALSYRFLTAEKRGNLFHQAVSLFVGKRVAHTLEDTEQIALTGSRETVTILFSDIRGFTAFCESKDPAVIVSLLNEYLSEMVAIIVSHGGHVNKFIGDGILAIFAESDAGGTGNHAERAVRCGTGMIRANSTFQTGVGIHTGTVILGNVGSADKLEYTALGDTVNLASRIESLNKELKQKILFSEDTCAALTDGTAGELVGSVQIRGRTTPMNVYTIPGSAAAQQVDREAVGKRAG